MIGRALAAGALLAACATPPERASCAQVVGGTWRVVAPADAAGADWALVDRGRVVEGFALSRRGRTALDDVATSLPPDVTAAPAVLDLERRAEAPGELTGTATRRYVRGTKTCKVMVTARIARCEGTELDLTIAPLLPPVDWTTCSPPATEATTLRLAQQAAAAP